jgi:uncharacterized protein (TIGR02284 family)
MLDEKAVIGKLNHILGTLRDGEKGYAEAAEEVTSAQYRSMFMELSQERAQLAEEVKAEIRRLGGDPDDSSSVGAALHRAWINVRDAITGKDDYAVIAEVERGEDVAVDNYQDVMKETLPADIQALLSRQYAQVKAAHDRMRDLKHSLQDA